MSDEEQENLTWRSDATDASEGAATKAGHACMFSCLGGILFWIALAALAWNEKRYVDQAIASGNDTHHHYLRIALWLVVCVACYMVLYPIYAFADIMGDYFDDIPCVGDAVEDAVESVAGAAVCCAAFVIGTAASLLVFGIAWCYYNPTVGIPVLCAGLLLILGLLIWKFTVPASEKRQRRQQRKGMIAPGDLGEYA